MVSPTQQTERVRAKKRKAKGRKRKNSTANHGSTKPREELFKIVKA